MSKLTTDEWIQKAILKHGNTYNYSKVNYINSRTKVIIICSIHGEFELVANNHLRGCRCPKCAIELSIPKISKSLKTYYKSNTNPRKRTTETFIEKAKEIHGDKYDYSKVEYVDSYTKVCIICPIHGEFWQLPSHHLSGHGCWDCSNSKLGTTASFILKANNVHKNIYCYDKVKYINSRTPVCIVCSKHGEFWLTPHEHLSGCGCPKCKLKSLTNLFNKLKETFYDKDILFEVTDKVIPWLDGQRFDIYFPNYNIAIEYNGKQHYIPVERFGGEILFQQQLIMDDLKRLKCKNNNCHLFEIKYDYTEEDYLELVKNISKIINYEIYT